MNHKPENHLVEPEDACPRCDERCVDNLIWIDDGEQVRCAACSTVYTPPRRPAEGGDPHAARTQ